MLTNQQTIKNNYLNQIREIFMTSRVDNSRSFFFFPIFHDLPSRSSSVQGTCGRTDEQRFFFFDTFDILNT